MELLERINCEVSVSYKREKTLYTITPPWYRMDLKRPQDIIEEIVRLFGVNNIPEQQLTGVLEVPDSDEEYLWIGRMKHALRAYGAFEVMHYSFYGEDLMKKCRLLPDKEHVEILNPLSDDLRYLRTTLLPRMLENVAKNQFVQADVVLFEVGHVYFSDREVRMLGVVVMDKANAYRRVRGLVETLLQELNVGYTTELISQTALCEFWEMYAGGQALRIDVAGAPAGTLAEVDPVVLKNLDIQTPVAYATLSIPVVAAQASLEHQIKPLSPYPAIPLDLSLIVDETVRWQDMEQVIRDRAAALLQTLEVTDVYHGGKIPAGKTSITCHVVLQALDRTLEMKEMELWRDSLVAELSKKFGAELRAK